VYVSASISHCISNVGFLVLVSDLYTPFLLKQWWLILVLFLVFMFGVGILVYYQHFVSFFGSHYVLMWL
jgi:hypothetical protein